MHPIKFQRVGFRMLVRLRCVNLSACMCVCVCVCRYIHTYIHTYIYMTLCVPRSLPVPVLSKAQFCDRLVAGIPGSNTFNNMDVYLLCLLCVSRIEFCDGLITRLEESYGACVSNGVNFFPLRSSS